MIEIILPIRNPTEVLRTTIESVLAQSSRDFCVLLSDNWSSKGTEFIEEAERRLQEAGIAVRKVRPPVEVGRVEHWNWSHHQGQAEWIKPLFTGDWLDAEYVAKTAAAIAAHPAVDIVTCSMASHYADGTRADALSPGGYHSPEQVLARVFREGNCVGAPINVCFRQLAFVCCGGYQPALPVSADFWLYLTLALRCGLVTCPEVLAHFHYHPSRFSTNVPWHRIDAPREQFIIMLAATSQAAYSEIPHDRSARNPYFWKLAKDTLKAWLHRHGIPLGNRPF